MDKKSSQSYWSKPGSIKFFGVAAIVILFMFIVSGACRCADTDMYFMIPTGYAIREHGIFHNNLWTIDKSSGFVAQQWLYDVILSYLDELGYWAFVVFTFVQVVLFLGLAYKLCRLRKMSLSSAILCVSMVAIFGRFYVFTIRPQTCTLILLLTECFSLEKFRLTKKQAWLILLPISMLLEMNLHMSMWFIHYAILLAYMCPSFYYKKAKQDSLYKEWKAILPFIIIMTAMLFVNPYGLEGVTYFLKSVTSNTFDYIKISEMMAVEITSDNGIIVVLSVIFSLFIFKLDAFSSTDLNMCVGFIVFMALAVRNVLYAPIVVLYMFFSIWSYIFANKKNIDWRKDITKLANAVTTIVCCIFITATTMSIIGIFDKTVESATAYGIYLTPIIDYLEENNVPYDTHIFTSVNSGAQFEYRGYNNVYVDARPELFSLKFTGDKDIARDYYAYVTDGQYVDTDFVSKEITHNVAITVLTEEFMKQWLDDYQFEYLVVDTSTTYLSGYLSGSPDYEFIDFGEDETTGPYGLYKRVS